MKYDFGDVVLVEVPFVDINQSKLRPALVLDEIRIELRKRLGLYFFWWFSAEVMDVINSIVFDQAENRLHAQKAILALLL